MTNRERFAADWNMDIDRVHKLVSLARECAKLNERAVNGDRHPRNPVPADKNGNSELWETALDSATSELERFAQQYGFSSVVYTGLGPTLMHGDKFVEIPY